METKNIYPIQIRDNKTVDDWRWFGHVDTAAGAQRLVAQWNRDAGWTKYRILPGFVMEESSRG